MKKNGPLFSNIATGACLLFLSRCSSGNSGAAPGDSGTNAVVQSDAGETTDGRSHVPDASVRKEAGPVGSCSALPAAGTWDANSIAPVSAPANEPSYKFDGKSTALIVDPFDAATVWLGTGNKGLFKSTDCGATWSHVNTGQNGDAIDQSTLWSMTIDPNNQGVIYTVAAYGAGGLWKSTNGGVDWVQLFPLTSDFAKLVPSNFIQNVSMDPANSLHLIASSHGVCNDPFPKGCIAESFDGGVTWPNIVSTPAVWGEKGGPQIVDATTWVWGGGDSATGTYVTTDNGKTWLEPPLKNSARGENSTQPLAPAADNALYIGSGDGVLRSTDGTNWSLVWAQKNFKTASVTSIATTATTIYTFDQLNFYTAPLSDYTNWSSLVGPTGLTIGGAGFLAYDEPHHLLYASCWEGGVFRYVIP